MTWTTERPDVEGWYWAMTDARVPVPAYWAPETERRLLNGTMGPPSWGRIRVTLWGPRITPPEEPSR